MTRVGLGILIGVGLVIAVIVIIILIVSRGDVDVHPLELCPEIPRVGPE